MPGNAWECLGMPAKVDKSLQMPAKVGKIPVNACKTKQKLTNTCKCTLMHSTKGTAQGRGQREWLGVWGMAWAWSNGNAGGVAWGRGLAQLGGVAWPGLFLSRSTKLCCTFQGVGCKSYS